jgi:hypothetical protein
MPTHLPVIVVYKTFVNVNSSAGCIYCANWGKIKANERFRGFV